MTTCHHLLRDAAQRHVIAEHGRADQDHEDHRRGADGRSQRVDGVGHGEAAEYGADHRGEQCAERAGLRRRGHAAVEQDQHQHDQQEAGPDPQQAGPALGRWRAECRGRMARTDHDPEIDHDAEQDAGDDARDDAGDQELADRGLRRDAVDHHRDAGRNENVERRADADRAGGQFLGIAVAAHLRHRDPRHHRGGRGARPRHRAENAAGEHGGDREPAADVRQPCRGGGIEVARQSARGREIGHQDEHRNGGELVVGDRAERHEADDVEHLGEVAGDQPDAEHAGAGQRHGDRHAEQQAHQQDQHRQRGDHGNLFVIRARLRRPRAPLE